MKLTNEILGAVPEYSTVLKLWVNGQLVWERKPPMTIDRLSYRSLELLRRWNREGSRIGTIRQSDLRKKP